MKLRSLNNFVKTLIVLIVVLNNSSFFAQTTNQRIVSCVDTINVAKDSLVIENSAIDTAFCRAIMFYGDSIRYNLKKPYNKDVFKFKYDSFREKMKDAWLGDILKEILFR